jgi:beta-glucanase (GH16 family)
VRKQIAIPAALWAGLLLAASARGQATGGAWQPVWADEFSGTSFAPTDWIPTTGAWPYNSELEYYSPSAITVANGNLTITSTNQAQGGRLYTSGRLEGRDRHSWLYGRFEMRAKLPGTRGLWPAFWLLPQDGSWPPEIDIMELLGHQPSRMYGTNHWPVPGGSQNESTPFDGPNFTAGFNIFACEWWPDRIDFFVNGQIYATHRTAIPQVPMYLILNTAVGGQWPGNPDATTVFPQRFDVDYVRVYQWDRPLLKDPGFEYEATTTRIMHWHDFGNAYYSNALLRTGRGACKMYGNFNTPYNVSGVYQDMPAAPGQVWTLSGYAQTPSWDRCGAGNVASINIEWHDAAGALISFATTPAISSATTPDQWRAVVTTATAPAGTATARAVLIFTQGPALAAGAVWWDDMSFTYQTPCGSADFNGDGDLGTDADIEAFFACLSGNCCATCGSADFNGNGDLGTDADIEAFFRVLGGDPC